MSRLKNSRKHDIQINNEPEFAMSHDSRITQNYQSTVIMSPSKISSIKSQPESYWSMQNSESRVGYLLVGPDEFKMTDALCVGSVDYDKRIEYLKNLIEKINAGDKYSWLLKKTEK